MRLGLYRTLLKSWYRIRSSILVLIWRVKTGHNVRFLGRTLIRTYDSNAIEVGDNVVFVSKDNLNPVGINNPTILCAVKGAKITIGHDCGFTSVVMNAREKISIGNFVKVGGNVRIFDNDFHPLDYNDRRPPERGDKTRACPVVIEDDVFIGTNAMILKGTHLGARSIVAAGSVLFGLEVPPDSLVRGNPAVIEKKVAK